MVSGVTVPSHTERTRPDVADHATSTGTKASGSTATLVTPVFRSLVHD